MTQRATQKYGYLFPRKLVLTDAVWRKAEAINNRRERLRLIRAGRIRPAYAMEPQLMVKVDGKWTPGLKINGETV